MPRPSVIVLSCLMWGAPAAADTVAEVQAAHRQKCGGETVFEVEPALQKLATEAFNPDSACAAAMAAPQQFCTAWEVSNWSNQARLDSAGVDIEALSQQPGLKRPLAELSRVRCVVDARRKAWQDWVRAHPDKPKLDEAMMALFPRGFPAPQVEWKGNELTLSIFEDTANLYEDTYPAVKHGWSTRIAAELATALAAQAGARFEAKCGARATASIALFGDEWLVDGSSATSMVVACSRAFSQLMGGCESKNKAGAAKVTELWCGPDETRKGALPCLAEKAAADADVQEKFKAVVAKKSYQQKKLSAACEAKVKALGRMPPTFVWKGGVVRIGLMTGSMDYDELRRTFKAELESRK